MKAKKSLGQHFLTSQKAIKQIIDAGDIHQGDTVLEIGPGKGVLTKELLAKAGKVVAIEKDRELIPYLRELFEKELTHEKLSIVEADILKWDPETLFVPTYKLIANIPYYITGAIIEKFLSTEHQPERMVLLMQREVAERIVARDGKGSILSMAIASYGTPSIIDRVPAGAFVPAPNVESAILLVETISRDFFVDCDEEMFFSVLKSLFGKKRKQVGKSFGEFLADKERAQLLLKEIAIDPKTRPEDISLLTWKKLTQAIKKYKNSVQ